MISWVVDRIPARTPDGRQSHTIIIYREAEALAALSNGAPQFRAVTETGLTCEPCGERRWRIPATNAALVAERDMAPDQLEKCVCESEARSTPTSEPGAKKAIE